MVVAESVEVKRGGRLLAFAKQIQAKEGDIVGIVGRSGCGKSTLLETLAGMRFPGATARFEVHGEQVESWRPLSFRTIQSFPLFHWLRAGDLIRLAAKKHGGTAVDPSTALRRMGASHLSDRYPHQLSGGERARVTLAIASALEARILLLDEPFNGLDAISKKELSDDILTNFREVGTSVFIVSHALEDIVALATRCLAFVGTDIREIRPITRDNLLQAIA